MRRQVCSLVPAATVVLWMGCAGPSTRHQFNASSTPVAVRFVMPAGAEAIARAHFEHGDTRLASDEAGSQAPSAGMTAPLSGSDLHVALWGGGLEGRDVTNGPVSLPPGSYTFAFFHSSRAAMLQGWMEVQPAGTDLADYLIKWKNEIPGYKQQIAYEFDLNGRSGGLNAQSLNNFNAEIALLNELETRLNSAIRTELQKRRSKEQQVQDLLRRSQILLFPGDDAFFRQTTQAAFNEEDLNAIAGGDPLSKVILVADYNEAKWKLNRVNDLYGDLTRCKSMMREEVDRLDRRKGLFLLTDHLQPFKQDHQFLQNEARLQTLLGAIERLDGHMNDLRQRRLALAFICELIAQDQTFHALQQEESELQREKSVLEVDRQRLDAIFFEIAPENPRRVTIERSRQRNIAALAAVDATLNHLQSARGALAEMTHSSQIIHRQGDNRLLAATMMGPQLPLPVREAVERESLMSVRLERGRNVFVPTGGEGASAIAAPISSYELKLVAMKSQPASQEPMLIADQPWTQAQPVTSADPWTHQDQPSTLIDPWPQLDQPSGVETTTYDQQTAQSQEKEIEAQHQQTQQDSWWTQSVQTQEVQRTAEPEPQQAEQWWAQSQRHQQEEQRVVQHQPQQEEQRWVPPQQPQEDQRWAQPQQPQETQQTTQLQQTQEDQWWAQNQQTQEEQRWTLQEEDANRDLTQDQEQERQSLVQGQQQDQVESYSSSSSSFSEAEQERAAPRAKLASHQEDESFVNTTTQTTTKTTTVKTVSSKTPKPKTECNLPWIIKLLVPPCWFMEDLNTDTAQKASQPSKKARMASHSHRESTTQTTSTASPAFQPEPKPEPKSSHPAKHARLTSQREKPAASSTTTTTTTTSQSQSKTGQQPKQECNCPWFIKLLVPPCWFVDDFNNN